MERGKKKGERVILPPPFRQNLPKEKSVEVAAAPVTPQVKSVEKKKEVYKTKITDKVENSREKPSNIVAANAANLFSIKKALAITTEADTNRGEKKSENSTSLNPAEKRPEEALTQEKVKTVWLEMVEYFKEKGKGSFCATLKSREPKIINDFTIEFSLQNALQEHDFEDNKQDLLSFLRPKLSNYKLVVKAEKVEIKSEDILYSDSSKLKALVKENPVIQNLLDTFGLEPEF